MRSSQMTSRRQNHGLRKVCGCGRGRWPKCPHAWHFSYKPRGGLRYRFSLDAELGRHIDSKTEAEKISIDLRSAINAGTFRRVAASSAPVLPTPSIQMVVTLDQFVAVYIERVSKASGKASWKDDAYLLATVRGHRTADGRRLGEWALSAITEDELEAFLAAQRAAEVGKHVGISGWDMSGRPATLCGIPRKVNRNRRARGRPRRASLYWRHEGVRH